MSNCETCSIRDWCSSEEMDRKECPVRFEELDYIKNNFSALCNRYQSMRRKKKTDD